VGPDTGLEPSTYADVTSATVLPDERIVITGNFDSVGGLRRRSIAALKPDGSIDPVFAVDCVSRDAGFRLQPCVIGRVLAAPDGSLLVSGNFHEIGGLAREGLAKLDSRTGSVDPLWRPFAPASTTLLAVFGRDVMLGSAGVLRRVGLDGRGEALAAPLVAAYSTTHNGRDTFFLARNEGSAWRVRRASAVTGVVDPSWQSRGFSREPLIAYDPEGDIVLASGRALPIDEGFGTGDVVAMIDASGPSVERAFWVNPQNYYTGGAMFVWNRYLYVLGENFGPRVLRFDLRNVGDSDRTFVSPSAHAMTLRGVDTHGRPLLTRYGFHGEEYRPPAGSTLLRLTSSGALDGDFRPFPRRMAALSRLARSLEGRLVLQGEDVSAVNGLMFHQMFRAAPDFSLDASWVPRVLPRGSFYSTNLDAFAADNAGWTYFSTTSFDDGGGSRPPVLDRLGEGGQRDATWNPSGLLDESVLWRYDMGIYAMLVDEQNGWLYIGGLFEGMVCGQLRRNLARVSLGSPCTADPAWQPEPDGAVTSMTLDPLGRLYIGGRFGNIGGQPILGLARFDDGVLDAGWRPLVPGPGDYSVEKIAATADDVFAALSFAPTGGLPSQGLIRFDAVTGSYDMDWRPPGADVIADLLITRSGHLVTSRRGIVYPGGPSALEAFDPAGTGQRVALLTLEAGQRVDAIAQGREPDAVVIAGSFEAVQGEARRSVAELYVEPRRIFADGFQW
jgi:hypothetical protein